MATVAGDLTGTPSVKAPGVAELIDRWIYVFMAGLFVATALVGFVPTSIGKVMAVQAGTRPPLPAVLHVHAVLMGSWLTLLLTQTLLMATGRKGLHMQLGMAGMVIAPAMVLTGFFLVPTMFGMNWAMMQAAPPGAPLAEIETGRKFISSLVAGQIMAGILFAIFVTLALAARKTDPGMHKRLMILATVIPLPAAIDRIAGLPATYPESVVSPMFALFIPSATLVINLWWNDWWIATAQRLMGVAD